MKYEIRNFFYFFLVAPCLAIVNFGYNRNHMMQKESSPPVHSCHGIKTSQRFYYVVLFLSRLSLKKSAPFRPRNAFAFAFNRNAVDEFLKIKYFTGYSVQQPVNLNRRNGYFVLVSIQICFFIFFIIKFYLISSIAHNLGFEFSS